MDKIDLSAEIEPEVTKVGLIDMQVCVPKKYTDEQVTSFANIAYPTGISSKWQIVRTGSKWLGDSLERTPCESKKRKNCVHIMLEC